MNDEINLISPFAGYLATFVQGMDDGIFHSILSSSRVLIFLSILIFWFILYLPQISLIEFFDRKLGADIQMRIGPNRVGRFGLFQFLADFLKSLFKEDVFSEYKEEALFKWGIVLSNTFIFLAMIVIPMSENWVLSSLDAGCVWIVFCLGMSQLSMFWASYSVVSEWSMLSAFRVFAMLAAYIAPITFSILVPMMLCGSSSMSAIVKGQTGMPWGWVAFQNPGALMGFVALFIAMLAWVGRNPFDHSKAEEEISGGYSYEYSGIRKNLILFNEYSSLFLSSAFIVSLYLGGWQTPFNLESFGRAANIVQWLFFSFKISILVFFSIWIRWSLPRLRIDQVILITWKILMPTSLVGVLINIAWMVFVRSRLIGEGS